MLIERDDVKGALLQRLITESAFNTQLLCNPCNVVEAKKKRNRRRLIALQVERYGARLLTDWVMSLGLKNSEPYLLRIQQAEKEMTIEQSI